mgnify:CR=1 FL=1
MPILRKSFCFVCVVSLRIFNMYGKVLDLCMYTYTGMRIIKYICICIRLYVTAYMQYTVTV